MPSLICVTFSPSPTFISRSSSGISRPSNSSSQCPPCSSGPMIGMRRTMRQPGWSRSNRNAVSPLRLSSEVFASSRKCCATPAPVMNHLRPRINHLSPFRSAVVSIMPGSEPAPGAGSVITMDERTLSVDDGLQPALLLLLGADLVEHHHVAVIGRGAVEGDRAEDRVIHLLVACGHADDGQALAAAFLRHLRRPQAGGLRPGAHLVQHVEADVLVVVVGVRVLLERQQVLGDESAIALAVVLDVRREG